MGLTADVRRSRVNPPRGSDPGQAKERPHSFLLCRLPSDWRPGTVTNPEDGQPFTDVAAWQFVADLLDRGEPLECVELTYPAGKKGYVMIPWIANRRVYVKFQLGAGKIIGRSFHYSDQP
jgi:hypothetical protein